MKQSTQNDPECSLSHVGHFPKISWKSVHEFFRNVANTQTENIQTNRDENNIRRSAEVMKNIKIGREKGLEIFSGIVRLKT